MSYYDHRLEEELSKLNIQYKKLEADKHDCLVNKINKELHFSGSKISWNALKNGISHKTDQRSIKLISEAIKNFNEAEVIFIGDALLKDAYQIKTKYLERSLIIFSEIPQHTYFFSENLNWIGCVCTEGYIDFGEVPISNQQK